MITEILTPDWGFNPVYNKLVYAITSTNRTIDNFKYLFTIEVNGTPLNKYFKVNPDPNDGRGYIDVKRAIETYITSTPDLSTTCFRKRSNDWVQFRVGYGEEYGLLSSGVTQYPNLDYSGLTFAYNGSFRSFDFDDYNEADWVMSGISSTVKFLTNKPRPYYIQRNQDDFLALFSKLDNGARYLTIKTYNSSGGLIDTFKINNSFLLPESVNADNFLRVVSGYNLNDVPGGQFAVGTPPVLTDSVYRYTMYIENSANLVISETYTYYIDQFECDYDTAYDVMFLNALGGFDTIRFNKFNSKAISVNRKNYKKAYPLTGGDKADRGKTQYYTDYEDKWTLRSAWLDSDESVWIRELISSPEVYIISGAELWAINITNTEWEQKSTKQGEVFNLTLNVEFSERNYRQRF